MHDPLIEFVGEIGDDRKSAFLGGADALLFPIDWPEPFGLVMIEAMACGTPVVAFDCGSVPEVVEPGLTGFIVRDIEGYAVEAVGRAPHLSRQAIRGRFEERFPATAMAERYVQLYSRPRLVAACSEAPFGESVSMTVDELSPNVKGPIAWGEVEEPRALQRMFALKDRDTFVVADPHGDILGAGDGVFHDDTRILSHWELLVDDARPTLLSGAISHDNVVFTAQSLNKALPAPGGPVAPPGILHIERKRFVWEERIYERLTIANLRDRGGDPAAGLRVRRRLPRHVRGARPAGRRGACGASRRSAKPPSPSTMSAWTRCGALLRHRLLRQAYAVHRPPRRIPVRAGRRRPAGAACGDRLARIVPPTRERFQGGGGAGALGDAARAGGMARG